MQWLVPRVLIKGVDEEERETAKVVAMKVAEKNDIQPPWIKAGLFHRQQRRRSTVQQEEPVGGFNEIATLVAAAVAEGIATAENMKLHELILRAI